MNVPHALPSQAEPTSLGDLVDDCRFLPPAVTVSGTRARPRAPDEETRSGPRPDAPAEIPDAVVALLDGMSEYGD